jgi:hypothetical protein
MKKIIIAALAIFATQNVSANIVFSCFTKNDKLIAIREVGNKYEYSFGKPGKPELVFRNTIKEVEDRSEHWNGVGWTYWEQYNMKNGQYIYSILKTVDRNPDDPYPKGELTVTRNGKLVTTILCARF